MNKTAWYVVLIGMFLFVSALVYVAGGLSGYVASDYLRPTLTPIVYVTIKAPTAQIVNVPQEIEVTREIPIEIIVTATPVPADIQIPTTTPELLGDVATLQTCNDNAWVVSQPISDLQASAMKIGQIKRLRFVIRNTGNCIWDGYVLTSGGIVPDIPIPYTLPSETADFFFDLNISVPLEARFVISPPSGYLFAAQNSAGPSTEIYYRLDIRSDETNVYSVGGLLYECGPFG